MPVSLLVRACTAACAALAVVAMPLVAGVDPSAPNDAFSDATIVEVRDLPFTDEITDPSSHEQGEPGGCDFTPGTVWYRITPAETMTLRADTIGSPIDNSITVFRGTAIDDLAFAGCGADTDFTEPDARVAFRAVAGQRYYVRIENADVDTTFRLRRLTPVPNDQFAKATAVTSLPFAEATSLAHATYQPGEPWSDVEPTMWYRVTPSRAMILRADTFDATFDTWLRVYRGTTMSTLTAVGFNHDTSESAGSTNGFQSNVAWRARADTRYLVQIGSRFGHNGPLTVRLREVAELANDRFANAQDVSGGGTVVVPNTRNATAQPDEPAPSCAGGTAPTSSLWYAWAPGSEDFVSISDEGSGYAPYLALYTGDSLDSLTEQDCTQDLSGGGHLFELVSSETHWIQVSGGQEGDSGRLELSFVPAS